MKSLIRHPWFLIFLRLIVGGVFTIAGFIKLQAPQEFADSIATFQLLPAPLINIVALSLPPFEILLGLALISGWKKSVAALGAFILSMLFTFALAQGLARGLTMDCGCFGSAAPSTVKNWASLGRDLLLIAAAFILYRNSSKPTPA